MATTKTETAHGPISSMATAIGATAWQQRCQKCFLSVHQWLHWWGLANFNNDNERPRNSVKVCQREYRGRRAATETGAM